jgi:protein tyrosine/serine phosphatase
MRKCNVNGSKFRFLDASRFGGLARFLAVSGQLKAVYDTERDRQITFDILAVSLWLYSKDLAKITLFSGRLRCRLIKRYLNTKQCWLNFAVLGQGMPIIRQGGTMNRYMQWACGLGIIALLTGGPVAYGLFFKANVRNFHQVREGVLYRSGQMSLFGLKNVIHDYNIKTVVTLRDAVYPGDPPPDLMEEKYCQDQEISYVRIPPRSWWAPAGEIPADEGIRTFLEVMDNPENYPVLVHCFGGIHRAGAFTAIYRMEYEHWTNTEAMAEMKRCGYSTLDDEWDISTYLEKYRPRGQTPSPVLTSNPLD